MLNKLWISRSSFCLGKNVFNLKISELSVVAIARPLIKTLRKYLLKRSYWIYPVP